MSELRSPRTDEEQDRDVRAWVRNLRERALRLPIVDRQHITAVDEMASDVLHDPGVYP